MTLTHWKTTRSSYLIRDRWMSLRADRCETANGAVLDPYYVLEPADWVQVVAFDSDNRILITRQYRHGTQRICTEIPCGTVESGESPEQAVRRELLEETGCISDSWQLLTRLSPNPACYSNTIHAFVATGTRLVQKQSTDETEEIEFEFLPVPEIFALIDSGIFCQGLHVATVLLALRALKICTEY